MKHRKVLALLSGGLDSTLAVKIVKDQGVDLEAVHFTTPFCLCDKCAVNAVGEEMGVKVHHIFMGQEFLNLLAEAAEALPSRDSDDAVPPRRQVIVGRDITVVLWELLILTWLLAVKDSSKSIVGY